MRREESRARAQLPDVAPSHVGHSVNLEVAWVQRPIIEWTLADVWEMHRRHGIKPNPLYAMGATRVGCGPCIFARKAEIRMIAERYPEAVDRVREWESIVGEAGKRETSMATFFRMRDLAGGEPMDPAKHGIDGQVDWSRTSRGGKNYSMFPDDVEIFGSCSDLGACE